MFHDSPAILSFLELDSILWRVVILGFNLEIQLFYELTFDKQEARGAYVYTFWPLVLSFSYGNCHSNFLLSKEWYSSRSSDLARVNDISLADWDMRRIQNCHGPSGQHNAGILWKEDFGMCSTQCAKSEAWRILVNCSRNCSCEAASGHALETWLPNVFCSRVCRWTAHINSIPTKIWKWESMLRHAEYVGNFCDKMLDALASLGHPRSFASSGTSQTGSNDADPPHRTSCWSLHNWSLSKLTPLLSLSGDISDTSVTQRIQVTIVFIKFWIQILNP